MSFSSETKQELCRINDNPRCQMAELAAFIHGIGTLRIGRGGQSVWMTTEVPAIARRIFSLCKAAFGVTPEVRTQLRKRLGKKNVYHVVLGPDCAPQILEETGLLRESGEGVRISRAVPLGLLRRSCCRHAYLRGAFLATGTLSDPGKGYHLEISSSSEDYAKSLNNFMNKLDLAAKMVLRRERYVVYLKESETIRITKDVRNNVNRAANCDSANLDKTMNAAQKQIEAIRLIEEKGAFSRMPRSLREIAEKRMDNPDMPLKELGEAFDPPISKSAVNHRLRKLMEFAAQWQTEQDEEK